MAWCELHYYNRTLQKNEQVSIILPEADHKGPFAVLYLLHGIGGDQMDWVRRTRLENYALHLPLMIVMPTTPWQSFYIDAPNGPLCATALAVDLVDYIDSRFSTVPDALHRAVCGNSMGGYGALHLAFQFPDRFGTAISHSGALGFFHKNLAEKRPEARDLGLFWDINRRLAGPNPKGGPFDLYAQAAALDPVMRPAVRLDCGTDDELCLLFNRRFHRYLDKIGYSHEYAEHPGNHNWHYWDTHISDTLGFFARRLGIEGI